MLMFSFNIFKLLLLLSLLSINYVSFAEEPPTYPVLKVGFMSSIKRLDDGYYVGSIPDIMKEAAAQTEYSLSLQAMPIKRLLKSLEAGTLDAAIGLFKRDERLEYASYLQKPIGWVCANLFHLKSNSSITDEFSSLYKKNIGSLRGASWGEKLKDVLKTQKTNQTQVSNYDMLAKMLIKERLDAVIASSEVFKSAIRKQNLEGDFVSIPLKYTPNMGMYILVSKQSRLAQEEQLVEKLNKALNVMSTENRFRIIYQSNGKTFDEHCHL